MRQAAALLAAAVLVLTGCSAATSNGFTAEPPGGWRDATDTAETRTGSEFEAVYEGTLVDGVRPVLTVTRVPAAKGRTVDAAATAARVAVDRRFEEADPTPVTRTALAGERALRFDYRTGPKRTRYVTARRGDHLYAVSMQAGEEGFARALVVLDDYLAGWRWDA